MATGFVSMTGNDTVMINNNIFTQLGDGNIAELTFPNDIAAIKTGKNGNSIYALNESGKVCEVKLRVLRAGKDDAFLNNLLTQQQQNFAGFPLMIGQFIKKIGDGKGNITKDTYNLFGGIFLKQVEAKTNVEGETDQALAVYMLKFSNTPAMRSLG